MASKEQKKEYQARYRERNRERILEQRKQWREKNKDKIKDEYWNRGGRDYHLKRKYGIGVDEYNSLFNRQNGCCAICEKPQIDMSKSLVVDHDHETGIVRGLLCNECNRALGYFYDDPDILTKATNYLIKGKI